MPNLTPHSRSRSSSRPSVRQASIRSSSASTCSGVRAAKPETSARTRTASAPPARAASSTSRSSTGTRQSRTVPIPVAAKSAEAARRPSIRSAGVGRGSTRSTSSTARLTSRPVSRPCSSRSITPPGGASVASVIPASRSAAELSTMLYAPRRTSTGWSAVAPSNSAVVGIRCSASSTSCQLTVVWIHSPAGVRAARSRIRARNPARSRARWTGTPWTLCAARTRCVWVSSKAGSTVEPGASTTSVAGPIRASRPSGAGDRAVIRPPVTAIARCAGSPGTRVCTAAARISRSAGGWAVMTAPGGGTDR